MNVTLNSTLKEYNIFNEIITIFYTDHFPIILILLLMTHQNKCLNHSIINNILTHLRSCDHGLVYHLGFGGFRSILSGIAVYTSDKKHIDRYADKIRQKCNRIMRYIEW